MIMDELEKQVAQKLKTIGFEQTTMPKETYKQLLIIEKWFENAVQKRQDLLEEARKTKFNLSTVAKATGCSRRTLYNNNQILKKYIEYSALRANEEDPRVEIEKLKQQNKELQEKIALLEAHDIELMVDKHDFEQAKNKNAELQKQLDFKNDRIRELSIELQNERRKHLS